MFTLLRARQEQDIREKQTVGSLQHNRDNRGAVESMR